MENGNGTHCCKQYLYISSFFNKRDFFIYFYAKYLYNISIKVKYR
jgi:hypothetical protein